MTEEMQKVQLKIERKISECQKAISEKNAQESTFKHKDQTIE